jgi:hypothetical protein
MTSFIKLLIGAGGEVREITKEDLQFARRCLSLTAELDADNLLADTRQKIHVVLGRLDDLQQIQLTDGLERRFPNQQTKRRSTRLMKWSYFSRQLWGFAKMHQVSFHAAFCVSILSNYAASGWRLLSVV